MTRLFVTSAFDGTDRYMAEEWAQPLLDRAERRPDSDLEVLRGPARQQVEDRLAHSAGLIFFGHGLPDTIGEPALVDRANVDRVNGTVVAVACRTAAALGPAAIEAGVDTYVGFIDDLTVIESPVVNELVRDGFEPFVLDGETPEEFEDRFTAACEDLQSTYLRRSRDREAYLIGHTIQIMKLALRVLKRDPDV